MKMTGKFRWTSSWFLSIHIILYLLLIFVQGNEETDDAFANGKNLVLEYFLPVNLPHTVHVKEKRDVEGSGDDTDFSDNNEKFENKEWDKANNSSERAFQNIIDEGEATFNNDKNYEGSGEIDDAGEKDKEHSSVPPVLEESEMWKDESSTTSVNDDSSKNEKSTEMTTEQNTSQNTVSFDGLLDNTSITTESNMESESEEESTETSLESTSTDSSIEKTSTEETITSNIPLIELVTVISTTGLDYNEQTTKEAFENEDNFTPTSVILEGHQENTSKEAQIITTTPPPVTGIPEISVMQSENPKESTTISLVKLNTSRLSTPPPFFNLPSSTEGISLIPEPHPTLGSITTMKNPVEEIIFKETKISHETMAVPPGNILQKKNMTLGVDPLLIITNTRLVDSDDADIHHDDSRRLGAYIVIGLILLSFLSLVGYFVFKRRQYRKRQDFESSPESQDTEKALLSLTDYKDNSELEENHLKNNEITPIVVKSNSQINKFEKNTNFSSPKNLNTIANEKNIEKDNVLKSTSENLTQVIIEDSPKEVEEDKNAPCMEKLIVKTRLDPDSIPKKPIIVNRTSAGYIPIPQDIV